jgi:very-short-patch-repair endonuclease
MKNYDYIFRNDTTENRESAYWKIFNMVNLLSVDFILADLLGNPIYAIELDGLEHETDVALIERDKIKAHVLNSITVPLLKIRNVELNNLSLLQQKVQGFAK